MRRIVQAEEKTLWNKKQNIFQSKENEDKRMKKSEEKKMKKDYMFFRIPLKKQSANYWNP